MSKLDVSDTNIFKRFQHYKWIIIFLFLVSLIILISIFLKVFFLSSKSEAVSLNSSSSPKLINTNSHSKLINLVSLANNKVAKVLSVFPQTSLDSNNKNKQTEKKKEDSLTGVDRSFGDGFSSTAYIDENNTDLVLDYNVTAFSFLANYSLDQDLSADNTNIDSDDNKSCLQLSGQEFCLRLKNNKLYLNNKPLLLPSKLRDRHISKMNFKAFNKGSQAHWLLGFVTGLKEDEQVWVYIFDGHNFQPLITDSTKIIIKPKYHRAGGNVYFGGTLNDFLILYNAYNAHLIYYHNGVMQDVSKLFGLRVSDGGFPTQIIRTVNTRGSVFYICSRGGVKSSLIKIWSNEVGRLGGSIDFSPILAMFGGLETGGCYLGSDSLKIPSTKDSVKDYRNIKVFLRFGQNSDQQTWIFTDKGFDNSHDYSIVSKDLGKGRKRKILAAKINNMSVYTDLTGATETVNYSPQMLKLFFANKNKDYNWREISPYSWYKFPSSTNSLYWKAVFKAKKGDRDYSPWFYALNDLLYKTDF